ncbi:MAG: serine protease [Kiritimatiellia bacterium]
MGRRLATLAAVALAVLSVAADVSPATRQSRSFEASISNLFSRLQARWEGVHFPSTSRMARDAFRSKRHDAFSAAKTKLAVIVSGARAGTGFLVREEGRTWLVTNAHVVRGQSLVRATMLDGTTLTLGAREYAAERDLARFLVDSRRPALEIRGGLPDVGERVTVLGNSDGRGVITEINGRILGVGPTELEIDAPFTIGNSGSPVIDRAGRVVAVASYLRDCRNDKDWTKKNTRFNGIRRFALRLSGIRWERAR